MSNLVLQSGNKDELKGCILRAPKTTVANQYVTSYKSERTATKYAV